VGDIYAALANAKRQCSANRETEIVTYLDCGPVAAYMPLKWEDWYRLPARLITHPYHAAHPAARAAPAPLGIPRPPTRVPGP